MLIILKKPFKAIILRLNNINNISKSTFIIRAVTKRNQLITSKKKTIFAFWSSLFANDYRGLKTGPKITYRILQNCVASK